MASPKVEYDTDMKEVGGATTMHNEVLTVEAKHATNKEQQMGLLQAIRPTPRPSAGRCFSPRP